MRKETYGYYYKEKCRLIYRYAITGIDTEQTELVNDLDSMMNKIFGAAEEQIEKELYARGLMTCNAYLMQIDERRVNGSDLVQAYIKELDEKYGDK